MDFSYLISIHPVKDSVNVLSTLTLREDRDVYCFAGGGGGGGSGPAGANL